MQAFDFLDRTAMLLGEANLQKLAEARVLVFGLGGVGGHLCEALARAGIGALDLVDHDAVSLSNLNRQVVALRSTLGRPKVAVMAERIADINPHCQVRTWPVFCTPDNAGDFPFEGAAYVADAVDTVAAKLEIAVRSQAAGVPLISAMGTGNKLFPEAFEVADITATRVCPLARVMRRELKKRGVAHLTVVYSPQAPLKPVREPAGLGAVAGDDMDISEEAMENGAPQAPAGRPKIPPGSVSFVPGAAGLVMAGVIVRGILGV